MNTEQKYSAQHTCANSSVQPVNPDADQQSLADRIPFDPGYINIPIYLAVHERNDNDMGASQLDVFFSALSAYRDTVAGQQDSNDKAVILDLIDDMRNTALDEVYVRLSESADILHSLKHNQPL